MVTVEQVIAYCERTLAARFLANDQEGLRRLQLALGVLIEAAQEAGDQETGMRLRVLAAHAANRREGLQDED
ncbi:hypothetical protein [Candidatus Chloroploca asiatica]|uniref:Uncharacterized protein n=1 Tax=Candidatus Chloroploca asiatica TaxID=1506545 RepID=A0A2H3KLU3_9CHLR|nr:hypothetical protein [Candidatus Chloroploca asiatica]PDV99057.1 hypothetical protein A9Q02_13935 [Candidatus Chloroploca asiatica]